MKIFNEKTRERAIAFIQNLNLDKKWEMVVKKDYKTRTIRQNNYYFFLLGIISNETGHTTKELHAIYKAKYLPVEEYRALGDKVYEVKSTTDLNTKEKTVYIEKIRNSASADLGIYTPDPGEDYENY